MHAWWIRQTTTKINTILLGQYRNILKKQRGEEKRVSTCAAENEIKKEQKKCGNVHQQWCRKRDSLLTEKNSSLMNSMNMFPEKSKNRMKKDQNEQERKGLNAKMRNEINISGWNRKREKK